MLGTVDSVLTFSLFYESKKEELIKYLYSYSYLYIITIILTLKIVLMQEILCYVPYFYTYKHTFLKAQLLLC